MTTYFSKDDQGRLTGRYEIGENRAPREGENTEFDSTALVTDDMAKSDLLVEPEDFNQYLVKDRQLVLREKLETSTADKRRVLADYQDVAVVSNLPKGTMVSVLFEDHLADHIPSVEDGRVRAVFSVPGEYVFEIDPFPKRAFKVTIDAVD